MQNEATPGVELNPDLTTKGKVRVLLGLGWSVREIAKYLDLTSQAIYLHVWAIRDEKA